MTSAAQLVCYEVARDLALHIEASTIRDAAIDRGLDPDEAEAEARKVMGNMYRAAGVRACRVCGCTDDEACEGGCGWVEDDLCSECVPKLAPKKTRGRRGS